jgi:hypothetical protein
MNKVLVGVFSFAAVLAGPMAFSGKSSAQSPAPVSTETIEKWNAELRDQVRRLEAEKENVELRRRQRRLQAEKENAGLHERVRQLQSDLSSAQSPPSQPPGPQPQRLPPVSSPPPVSTPQPQRAASASIPQPQRAAPAERKPSRHNETATRRESPRQAAVEQPNPASAFPEFAAFPSAAAPAVFPTSSDVPVVIHGTLDLDSLPEGATAQTSLGGWGCETPCSLKVSSDKPFSVTFKHRGYAPGTVNIQIQRGQPGVTDSEFSPNPVFVQLTPTP